MQKKALEEDNENFRRQQSLQDAGNVASYYVVSKGSVHVGSEKFYVGNERVNGNLSRAKHYKSEAEAKAEAARLQKAYPDIPPWRSVGVV